MSSAILRRNSSKQGLQNLLRVTAQRSIEDAEEIERERRRRARDALRKESSLIGSAGSPLDSPGQSEDSLFESEFKPSSPGGLEEDEGFSDWTQRLERSSRARQEENCPTEKNVEVERAVNGATRRGEKISSTVLTRQYKVQDGVEGEGEYRSGRKSSKKQMESGEQASNLRDQEVAERKEEVTRDNRRQEVESRPHIENMVKENRKEVKVSYTSKVFLQHDRMPIANNEDNGAEEVTSQQLGTRKITRSVGLASEPKEQAEASLETEQKLEKIRRSHQEKESQELENLRQRQAEAEVELEELKKKREERRRVREEEERRKDEEEQYRIAKEEEEKRQMKEDIERRRMEAAERRMKNLSTSCSDGDDSFSPKSSTIKRENEERLAAENTCSITERTESLNRSLKKSNSFKKTQPPVLLSKIDDRLEQYTHAVESSSKEPKVTKPAVVDMPSVPEPVAAKKNLFEAGEAWNQATPKGTPSKDTDGLKVGVADLITQWVKGSPEGTNRGSPSKPSDVKAGDVLQKKNLWEIIGEESAGGRSGSAGKGGSSGKRYKFVVTGHGKYEKVSIDDEQYSDYRNGKSRDLCHSDL